MNPMRARLLALPLALASLSVPRAASAFCGFYVGGADAKLFNNATLVVMMRGGTRTVLSMQNNYQGPPSDFAMVVPVPVVLQKENVKTLPREVFDHVDKAASPRLVEYWEQDPCGMDRDMERRRGMGAPRPAAPSAAKVRDGDDLGVKVEAEFTVGEYEVVILAAEDSLGLDTWLRRQNYKIPDGAEPLLRPYVAQGMKFFVAKVNASKVRFANGQAMLSPLRFHYDAETFNLPIRLGLMNSAGTQDLIVHIFARERYDVANHPNVTIPTNLDVAEAAKDQFPAFYAALFDRTVEKNPGAVVTEYAWDAQSCDPCPGPVVTPGELLTLGADVLPVQGLGMDRYPGQATAMMTRGFVLTRLHARYTRSSLGDDLVFRAARPITGGREVRTSYPNGPLERGAITNAGSNNFQGRYAVRHPWTGPVSCDNPRRGNWGGPPGGGQPPARAAQDLAFAPRGKIKLASYLRSDVSELDVVAAAPSDPPPARPRPLPRPPLPGATSTPAPETSAGIDGDTVAVAAALAAVVGLVGLLFGAGRRKG